VPKGGEGRIHADSLRRRTEAGISVGTESTATIARCFSSNSCAKKAPPAVAA
jgi:hypothetical protein